MKRIALCILLAITQFTIYAQERAAQDVPDLADRIVAEARKHLGDPYGYGASGPRRFDCSGFTSFIYSKFGYKLGHSSSEQLHSGRVVSDLSEMQKGDIVVFSGRRSSKVPGHVGIFVETEDDGQSFSFIHASRSGVIVSHLKEEYYSRRYIGARRYIPDIVEVPDTTPVVRDCRDTLGNAGQDGIEVREDVSALQEEKVADSPKYYTICSGDTLSAISKKYHTSVKDICRMNGITEKTVLRIGRRIRVK